MNRINIRKLNNSDRKYFTKWWRDKDLIALTSGNFEFLSDEKIDQYFIGLFNSENFNFIITLDKEPIGHIALSKRKNFWYEIQIVIGEKQYWNGGYGTKALRLCIKRAAKVNITNIFLEVRPDNCRAIRAYEKVGFIQKKLIKYPNDKYMPEILRMELIINKQ